MGNSCDLLLRSVVVVATNLLYLTSSACWLCGAVKSSCQTKHHRFNLKCNWNLSNKLHLQQALHTEKKCIAAAAKGKSWWEQHALYKEFYILPFMEEKKNLKLTKYYKLREPTNHLLVQNKNKNRKHFQILFTANKCRQIAFHVLKGSYL